MNSKVFNAPYFVHHKTSQASKKSQQTVIQSLAPQHPRYTPLRQGSLNSPLENTARSLAPARAQLSDGKEKAPIGDERAP